MVESCVRLAGFSADALLMDRHRTPAMSRDSICFGVYVDGVCAVGCNRSKLLAALEAVKVTLDAAVLRCSEVESDTSKASIHRSSVGSEDRCVVAGSHGGRSGRVWPAVAPEFRWIASSLALLTCNLASPSSPWVYATPRVAHREAMVLRVANVILKRLPQQAAVRNDGGSLPKNLFSVDRI